MKIVKRTLLIFICLFLLVVSVFFGYYFAVTKNLRLSEEKLNRSGVNVTVYDVFGKELSAEYATQKQQIIPLALPKHVQYAFTDTEDKHFYSHNGFDYARIVKAFFKNLSARSFKEGASTISQQLIKNTHLSHDKTLKRKLQEWKLTRQLEKQYSKDEILETYLSVIYFGHNCFGIASASAFYFGKSPKELSLGEASVLAGLVKSPNNYSPFKSKENCIRRKRIVLANMQKNGHVNEEEIKNALNEPLPTAPTKHNLLYGYSHCVFNELEEIAESHSLRLGGKIRVDTYCNPFIQNVLEEASLNVTNTDKTLGVIDVKTCGFSGFVSSVNNVKRSPASLLKPLLCYAPAIEENVVSPATPILDERVDFAGYSPKNYDGKFNGYVSARESLARSLNVPAVKTLNSVTVTKATQYLDKLGLRVDDEDKTLALALGGMKNGFGAKELFSAYTVFPNGGNYRPSRFIQSIYIDGRKVYTNPSISKRVFSEDTAYLTADALRTAVESGTAKKLRTLDCPIYAKTGTAGTENGNTDAYTVAFTEREVIGVWLGNADRSIITHTGGGAPCNLIYNVQSQLLQNYQANGIALQKLRQPQGVIPVNLDKYSYENHRQILLADPHAPAVYQMRELFKKSCVPTKTSDVFSKPNIPTPDISISDFGVEIRLQPQALYRYKITRCCEGKETLVYDGEYTPTVSDNTVESNKQYVYTVTPYYQSCAGKSIRLPAVNTLNKTFIQKEEKKILDKTWWEY